jgi:hypothetical protein
MTTKALFTWDYRCMRPHLTLSLCVLSVLCVLCVVF